MKRLITLVFASVIATNLLSQCQVYVQVNTPDCDSLCNGSLEAFPNGTPPFSYVWSNGDTSSIADNLCASMQYTVTVTDSLGCVATGSGTMYPVMQVVMTVLTPPSCSTCCDGVLQGTAYYGSCMPYTYSWQPTGLPGATQYNVCPGSYTLCVVNSCGCVRCTAQTVNSPAGIQEATSTSGSFYPQPLSDQTTLQLKNIVNDATLEIYDCYGKLVRMNYHLSGSQVTINRSGLDSGVYFCKLSCDNSLLYAGRLVVSDLH